MKISEAASGVGEEMADVGMAMQRAVDKTENMRARANAMDELEASGAFDDQLCLTAGQDDIDRQLHELSSAQRGRRRPRAAEGRARPGHDAAAGARVGRGRPEHVQGASVIVRISTEGQYEIPDEDTDRLNALDNEAVAAVEAGDEERFHELFESLLELRAQRRAPGAPTTCSRSPT